MTDRRLICAFTLNGRPQPWQRVATSKFGVQYVPKETKEFQKRVRVTATARMIRGDGKSAPPGAPVEIEVVVYYAWPKTVTAQRRMTEGEWAPTISADWDNLGKTVSDALQESKLHGDAVCYMDDRQVVRGVCEKRRCDSKADERMEVRVWDLSGKGLL